MSRARAATPPIPRMQLAPSTITRQCAEREIYDALLPLDGACVVELGCGRAEHTRAIAASGRVQRISALEVDEIQHALNLEIDDLPNVEFLLAGAQAIPAAAGTFDIAMMFKSLHHVPGDLMLPALREISRVLKPGGVLYVSEPIFAGAFNDILRLFHDEEAVRRAAFDALAASVGEGTFELVDEVFFNAPMSFRDFAEFERKVIGVTHTRHRLTPVLLAEVRQRFEAHATPTGVRFAAPMRVDLLRKPLVTAADRSPA